MAETEIHLDVDTLMSTIEENIKTLVFTYAEARDDELRKALDEEIETQVAGIQHLLELIEKRLDRFNGRFAAIEQFLLMSDENFQHHIDSQ